MTSAPQVDENRGLLLETIDRQFEEIGTRLMADVAAARSGLVQEGFVLYHLRNLQGEPLKDTQTESHGITMDTIMDSEGFRHLTDKAADLNVSVRVDQHFYSSHPQQVRIYRVLADGW